ncbi:hypothetical protein SCE1572_34975 [Sorangium cellulosum So0157-2]|uniref:NleD-like pathogen effector protein (Putative zinc metallopeptidase) n=2 Tax=Sorangium cellulosum TaxID=56 RepID=S4Y4T2_SORCE|nr:hypothetical protein SCE1572_34975 [Sorangium cellulosum So0157-2]
MPGMPSVLVGALPASRLADYSACLGAVDVTATGAAMVLIGGLPAARVADETAHRGVVVGPGATMVLIGGPTFALPPNVTVEGPPDFQNKVIRDLYFLSTTPSGQELFRRLDASGRPVKIVPESDPQNSFCTANDATAASDGTGTGSTVSYNPDARVNAYDRNGNPIAEPSQVLLGHEMAHALANAEGRRQTGTDPAPPASQPDIGREEAQAIGTGSHNGAYPSENSFRRDLGLPERDNHYWTPDGPDAALPPTSLRPGGY